jgi:hypothetical protein
MGGGMMKPGGSSKTGGEAIPGASIIHTPEHQAAKGVEMPNGRGGK